MEKYLENQVEIYQKEDYSDYRNLLKTISQILSSKNINHVINDLSIDAYPDTNFGNLINEFRDFFTDTFGAFSARTKRSYFLVVFFVEKNEALRIWNIFHPKVNVRYKFNFEHTIHPQYKFLFDSYANIMGANNKLKFDAPKVEFPKYDKKFLGQIRKEISGLVVFSEFHNEDNKIYCVFKNNNIMRSNKIYHVLSKRHNVRWSTNYVKTMNDNRLISYNFTVDGQNIITCYNLQEYMVIPCVQNRTHIYVNMYLCCAEYCNFDMVERYKEKLIISPVLAYKLKLLCDKKNIRSVDDCDFIGINYPYDRYLFNTSRIERVKKKQDDNKNENNGDNN